MTVYILTCYDNNGFNSIIGVYSTMMLAQQVVETCMDEDSREVDEYTYHIEEFELDVYDSVFPKFEVDG